MVLNAIFNNISVISWCQFYWWRKPEDPKKTTDLSQFNINANNINKTLTPYNTKVISEFFSHKTECVYGTDILDHSYWNEIEQENDRY